MRCIYLGSEPINISNLTAFLDRMAPELESDAACSRNALAHALGQLKVMAIAGGQVGAGLRNADDRLLALQLLTRKAEI